MNTQLLCTFTNKKSLDIIIDSIKKSYNICFDKIYTFTNENDKNEIICTYNVFVSKNLDYNLVPNTISVHRKKQTNTLYTINALNELIKNMNNGVLDKSFEIPWENFQNMLLVTNSEGLNKINTKINNIYSI